MKRPMLVLGMMSGTSADGIDVALARISGAPPTLNAKLLGHTSAKFPPALRKEILRVAEQHSIAAGALSQLNFRLGRLFADAAIGACRYFRVPPSKIALIGSHGQTIFHQGRPIPCFGSQTASTLQIGEPSVIATRTVITTDPYLKVAPPKSTGREYYGHVYVKKILALGRRHRAKPNDLIRAATIFTALSVVDALNRFVLRKTKIHQLIVSGGGAHNPLILAQLAAALPGIQVLPSSRLGIPEDAKEALAFAILAYETFHQRPANLPSSTSARRPSILRRITYAPPR